MMLLMLALAVAEPLDAPRVEPLRGRASVLIGSGCNVVVVEGADGLLLIDDQRPSDYRETLALLSARYGVPVREVVNTHFHLDHSGGNAQFARDGALVVGQENVRVRLSEPRLVASYRAKLPGAGTELAPRKTYATKMTLRFGGETLRLVHIPAAHTDGDTLVRLERSNVLHMGDVFFNGLYPHIDTDSGGSIRGNIRAVDAALRMSDGRTRIVPGHGPVATRTELLAYRDMLVSVASDVRTQIAAGHDLAAVLASRPADRYRLEGSADQFVTAVFEGLDPAKGRT